jgi:hypothetical protein
MAPDKPEREVERDLLRELLAWLPDDAEGDAARSLVTVFWHKRTGENL